MLTFCSASARTLLGGLKERHAGRQQLGFRGVVLLLTLELEHGSVAFLARLFARSSHEIEDTVVDPNSEDVPRPSHTPNRLRRGLRTFAARGGDPLKALPCPVLPCPCLALITE